MLGLYIHIPFCSQICPYCDFNKMVAKSSLRMDYLAAMKKEATLKEINNHQFDTVYVGGGTPSSLTANELEFFFNFLSELVELDNLKEFTFECNPLDITDELLKILKRYHVSRISIGVQTLNPFYQELIKRKCTLQELEIIVARLHKFNFTNYSFDLMYGFYNQTINDIKSDIDLLATLKPTHISIYSLIIEDHTYFGLLNKNKQKLEASDSIQSDMYQFIIDYLKKLGYHQYETSNFAQDGFESIHNKIYWNDDHYYSLGTGASSYIGNKRIVMTTKIHDYIKDLASNILPKEDIEELDLDEQIDEYVMMNLRKNEGINLKHFYERFNISLIEKFPIVKRLIDDEKLLDKNNDCISIKQKYRYIANYVIVRIISNK